MTIPSQATAEFYEVNDPRWPERLAKMPFDFFHLPGYLQASAVHQGGDPLLFILEAGDSGMLIPLLRRPLACFGEEYRGFFDVTSPYGYPGLLCWGEDPQGCMFEFQTCMDAFLREQNIVSMFLRLNSFVGVPAEVLATLGEVQAHGPTVFMDLREPDGSWLGITEQNRRFISRSLKRGYEIRIDQWDTLPRVVEAYYESLARLGSSPFYYFPLSYFQQLRTTTAPHFHLATCYAPTGEILGGAFFTEVNGLIHYFLMGYFDRFLEDSPSKLLVNGLRTWGLDQGHHTLHLGGGAGVRRDSLFEFKRRMSDKTVTFSTFRKVLLPDTYSALVQKVHADGPDTGFFPLYRQA